MYPVFNKVIFFQVLAVGLCAMLSACDSSTNSKQQAHADVQNSTSETITQASPSHDIAQHGKKLTEVAGQATLPAVAENKELDHQPETISKKAHAFVGRYHVQISCDDPFAMCDRGSSEFIINLLPDGTAHRTLVYMGKMTYENNAIKTKRSYQKNTWTYDEASHEIIIHRVEGIHFFYKVDADKNLVMDLDKILNGTEENKAYFQQNNSAPTKSYVLKKFDN